MDMTHNRSDGVDGYGYGEGDPEGDVKPKRVWPDEKILRRRLMNLLHSIAVGDMGKRPEPKGPKAPGPKKVKKETGGGKSKLNKLKGGVAKKKYVKKASAADSDGEYRSSAKPSMPYVHGGGASPYSARAGDAGGSDDDEDDAFAMLRKGQAKLTKKASARKPAAPFPTAPAAALPPPVDDADGGGGGGGGDGGGASLNPLLPAETVPRGCVLGLSCVVMCVHA